MDQDQRIDFLITSQETLHNDIRDLYEVTTALRGTVEALRDAVAQDAESIRALARIAEIHDRRLTDLEGGQQST